MDIADAGLIYLAKPTAGLRFLFWSALPRGILFDFTASSSIAPLIANMMDTTPAETLCADDAQWCFDALGLSGVLAAVIAFWVKAPSGDARALT